MAIKCTPTCDKNERYIMNNKSVIKSPPPRLTIMAISVPQHGNQNERQKIENKQVLKSQLNHNQKLTIMARRCRRVPPNFPVLTHSPLSSANTPPPSASIVTLPSASRDLIHRLITNASFTDMQATVSTPFSCWVVGWVRFSPRGLTEDSSRYDDFLP